MNHRARSPSLLFTSLLPLVGACESDAPRQVPAPSVSLFDDGEEARASIDPKMEPSAASNSKSSLRFTDVTAQWGVELVHHAGRGADKWIPEIMNGGVALLDVDRDGDLDILLVDGGRLTSPGERAGAAGALAKADAGEPRGPRLLLGDGKGAFVDATQQWGLQARGYGMGVAAGDVNNDGWVDLYLTTYDGKDRLLLNKGKAGVGFVDVTESWGVAPSGWSTSAAFLDIDSDGDLDLYVGRYVSFELERSIKCRYRGIHVYCTPNMYEALPDRLLRNDGGHFTDISASAGIESHVTKTLALATGDLDDDGDTDLYIAGDSSQNLLWLNDAKGGFSEAGIAAGVALSRLGREEASMGVAVSDSDADGRWDLAVTNFQAEPTSLYRLGEHGSYRERSDAAGIGASARARLSFGIEWLDADNDGDEDLLTANGHISDNISTYREQVNFAQLNSLYERVGDGRFVDVSEGAGSALAHPGVSRGLATGDLDNDGGVDYLVVDNDGAVQVARNETQKRGHFISLWLEGRGVDGSNRSAIGAQVSVRIDGKTLRAEVRGATSYLSVSDRRVHIGLGTATKVEAVTVRWPSGLEQDLGAEIGMDSHLRVVEGAAPTSYVPGAEVIAP